MWLLVLSSVCLGQDYVKLYTTKGYFRLEEAVAPCQKTLALSRKKADRQVNYRQARPYQGVDFIFVHVRGNNGTYNPVTPCRIVADSTAKFGWYLVTLGELSLEGKRPAYDNTWTPPLNQADFRLYDKECFDQVVIQDQLKR